MIIGMCGYAGSGKDAAAKALRERGFTRVAFADELKDELAEVFGLTLQELEDNKEEWRPLLVEWGRARRRQDPAYWIKKASLTVDLIEGSALGAQHIVVTDVRYPNEAKWLWERNGLLVRIERPGVGPANDEEATTIAEIDKIATRQTFWLKNDGSLEDLHNKMTWGNLP